MGLLWQYNEITELHYSLIRCMCSTRTVRSNARQEASVGRTLTEANEVHLPSGKMSSEILLSTLTTQTSFQCHYLKCCGKINVTHFYNTKVLSLYTICFVKNQIHTALPFHLWACSFYWFSNKSILWSV